MTRTFLLAAAVAYVAALSGCAPTPAQRTASGVGWCRPYFDHPVPNTVCQGALRQASAAAQRAARRDDAEQDEWARQHPQEAASVLASWQRMRAQQAECYGRINEAIAGSLGVASVQNPSNFGLFLAANDAQRTAQASAEQHCGTLMALRPRFTRSPGMVSLLRDGRDASRPVHCTFGAAGGVHDLGMTSARACDAWLAAIDDLSGRGAAALPDCAVDLKPAFPSTRERHAACQQTLAEIYPFWQP